MSLPKKKRAKRPSESQHPEPGGLSRREVLELGAAAGAATIITSRKSHADDDYPDDDPPPGGDGPPPANGEPEICLEEPANSPPHTPFAALLPTGRSASGR